MSDDLDRRIAALAKRQHGYVKRPQLLALGLGAKAIDYRIRIGRLIPVYAGVYAVGHVPTLPQDRAYAALLACGPGAVLSHGTAAAVWGIFKRWEIPFEVTAAGAGRRRGIRIHRAALERKDVAVQIGLPVTSAARMLLDVAPRLTDKALRRAVNDLRLSGYLHMDQLADIVDRFPRSPAAPRLRPLLDVPRGGPTRSEFEDDFIPFLERFGLPRPETNVWIAGREVDVWFPEERVIVELDGYRFHSDRVSFERNRDDDATALALGIATVRITKRRVLKQPDREAERLRRILESRRAA